MSEAQHERLGAVAGIVFVVLLVLAGLFLGSQPGFDEPARKVARFLGENRGEIQLGAALTGVAAIAFFVFLATLVRLIREAEGDTRSRLATVVLAGGILMIAFMLIGWALLWTASVPRTNAAPKVLDLWVNSSNVAFTTAIAVGFTTIVAATSLAGHLTRALPPLLVQFGGLVTIVSFVAGFAAYFKETGAFSAADGAIPMIAFAGFLIWALVLSGELLRRAGRADGDAPAKEKRRARRAGRDEPEKPKRRAGRADADEPETAERRARQADRDKAAKEKRRGDRAEREQPAKEKRRAGWRRRRRKTEAREGKEKPKREGGEKPRREGGEKPEDERGGKSNRRS